MESVVARGVCKTYGDRLVLDRIDLRIDEGRVVGLIGPNGAGKSTLLQALLGFTRADGVLRVLGRDPWRDRAALMRSVGYVADIATMPRWLRASQALDFSAAVHPAFDRATAHRLLAQSEIDPNARVGSLSKGLVVQLQLALAMSVDARLVVLDEPTLGLDVLYRKRFFDTLLGGLADGGQTAIVATHDLDEVESLLTDLIVLHEGRIALACTMEEYEARFVEVHVHPEHVEVARTMRPIHERSALAGRFLIFDGADVDRITLLGELRRPSLAALCAAVVASKAEMGSRDA